MPSCPLRNLHCDANACVSPVLNIKAVEFSINKKKITFPTPILERQREARKPRDPLTSYIIYILCTYRHLRLIYIPARTAVRTLRKQAAPLGKHRHVSQPQWTIKGHQLKITDTFSYLGAVFGNGGSAEHVNQRIRAAKNGHRSLQAAGLHANGLDWPQCMCIRLESSHA